MQSEVAKWPYRSRHRFRHGNPAINGIRKIKAFLHRAVQFDKLPEGRMESPTLDKAPNMSDHIFKVKSRHNQLSTGFFRHFVRHKQFFPAESSAMTQYEGRVKCPMGSVVIPELQKKISHCLIWKRRMRQQVLRKAVFGPSPIKFTQLFQEIAEIKVRIRIIGPALYKRLQHLQHLIQTAVSTEQVCQFIAWLREPRIHADCQSQICNRTLDIALRSMRSGSSQQRCHAFLG